MSTLKHLRALENSLAYRACQVLPDDVHQCRRLLILINHVVEHEEVGVGNAGASVRMNGRTWGLRNLSRLSVCEDETGVCEIRRGVWTTPLTPLINPICSRFESTAEFHCPTPWGPRHPFTIPIELSSRSLLETFCFQTRSLVLFLIR